MTPEHGDASGIPTIILGGSGYVAGEMLRLVAGHPHLALAAAVSTTLAGEPIAATFVHMGAQIGDQQFASLDAARKVISANASTLLLSAAPHGASAEIVAELLGHAAQAGTRLSVVDASADFRFADPQAFAAVYGHSHPAPNLLPEFTCAVPEHQPTVTTPHAAHPGCFATAMLLGIVPLVAAGLCEPDICVSAVTGSTGAGRTPRETTHHPVRQSNLFAYQVLKHRHSPEVASLVGSATGQAITLHFVPHSGPFARGIHASIFARKKAGVSREAVLDTLNGYYSAAPFVGVLPQPPRMKDIAGSNYAQLSADVDEETIVVTSVIDNLLKGAAGGSLQWANRLLGLPEQAGLEAVAPGWL